MNHDIVENNDIDHSGALEEDDGEMIRISIKKKVQEQLAKD